MALCRASMRGGCAVLREKLRRRTGGSVRRASAVDATRNVRRSKGQQWRTFAAADGDGGAGASRNERVGASFFFLMHSDTQSNETTCAPAEEERRVVRNPELKKKQAPPRVGCEPEHARAGQPPARDRRHAHT